MRFITEYEHDDTDWDKTPAIIGYRKVQAEERIGHFIASVFGWDEVHHTTQFLNTTIIHKHTLEIEAFPMNKWIEFKNKLLFEIQESAIHGIPISPIRTLELIKDLEFYSNNKQSVESWLGNV